MKLYAFMHVLFPIIQSIYIYLYIFTYIYTYLYIHIYGCAGALGYFPSYTLGAMMAAQFFETAETQIPDLKLKLSQVRMNTYIYIYICIDLDTFLCVYLCFYEYTYLWDLNM
jgi:hypothetical protein